MTRPLFREDAYLREVSATVLASGPEGVLLDATNFYAQAGGQPGDTGVLAWTREPRLAGAAARHLSRIARHPRSARVPLTTVLLGQVEAGDIAPACGDPHSFRLVWRGKNRLPLREAALLAVSLDL